MTNEEAVKFVQDLHSLFLVDGSVGEQINTEEMSQVISILLGELAAAAIFLSEDSFEKVPQLLRSCGESLKHNNPDFTDTAGITAKSVPVEVIQGFFKLASRIENTRRTKALAKRALSGYGNQVRDD